MKIKTIKPIAMLICICTFKITVGQHDSAKYCVSSAVEEKLELTGYYPAAFSFIGQFWDTSHHLFALRTRQNVWVEPELQSGFGFVSAEGGIKRFPIYLSLQARFNSHTSIWWGINNYLSDIKPVNRLFYQLQLGAYRNFYANEYIYSGYMQTKPILDKLFVEGFVNYYTNHNQYNFEIELGFKVTHSVAIMAGFEHIEGKYHFLGGIRLEMYEHKNQR